MTEVTSFKRELGATLLIVGAALVLRAAANALHNLKVYGHTSANELWTPATKSATRESDNSDE